MKKPAKSKKTTPVINLNYNKVESKLFVEKGVESIEIDGTILRREYICDNNDNDIYLTVATMGNVELGSSEYKLGDEWHTINDDEKQTLGTNNELDGKKLKISRSVSGEVGASCTVSVWIEGGYRDMVYRLSSEVGANNSVTFVIYVEFI